ncbi:alpha/beta fold hydrolase BchO [Bradyrhizobium sp.]|uniref:alpha/beta fold hydrolase BchO n=1 Tax=Bradyrhizobium sp. TaxID=376 RepID=UPI000B1F8D14|nr:alpha/beta fold hydrolase BchO [Bradyrhizobium sp.]
MPDLVWSRDGGDWPNRDASLFVEAAGFRWHVQKMGQGPQLLLLHGTGAATHSWRGLAPILAQHFAVIAPDLPGHAFTQSPSAHRLSLPGMASDVSQLLRVLDAKPAIVVGHSAGAAILARMCLDGKIAPCLLVSLNGAFMPFGGIANHLFSPLAKLLIMNPLVPRMFASQASTAGAVERLLQNTGSAIDAQGIALYRKLVRSPRHVAAALRMMANWRLEPLLHDLPRLAPALLLVAASNDRSISPEVARKVREIVSQAVIERVPGLGHLAHEEQPKLIADLVARYAARTRGAD